MNSDDFYVRKCAQLRRWLTRYGDDPKLAQLARIARAFVAKHDSIDVRRGIAWFNGLTELERAAWLARANSAAPADAWQAFKSHAERATGAPT